MDEFGHMFTNAIVEPLWVQINKLTKGAAVGDLVPEILCGVMSSQLLFTYYINVITMKSL